MRQLNPYTGIMHTRPYSPESYEEYIIECERRIKELTTAIQQAEQYLSAHPGCRPVLFRLNTMARDKAIERSRLAKYKHDLELLLNALDGVRPHSRPAKRAKS